MSAPVETEMPAIPLNGLTSLGTEIERKPTLEHLEESKAVTTVPVSAYANLTFRQTLRTFWKTSALCLGVLFIATSDGFQFTLPGQIIAQTSFIQQFGTVKTKTGVALDANHVSAWGGMYSGAFIAAALVSAYPAEWLGRRFNMLLLNLLMTAACLCEIFARSWEIWGLAKLFDGLSLALCQMTLSTYVSEIAPPQLRGAMLVAYSFWFAFGQFTAAIAIYILQQMTTRTRLYIRLIYVEWLFIGLTFIIIFLIPESPRYLVSKGKRDQARKILLRLNGSIPGYDVDNELAVLEFDLDGELKLRAESAKTSYLDLFKGINLRRTLVSVSVLAYQQLCGITIVYGYNSVFFAAAGLKNPFLGTVTVQLISLVTVFLSGVMVDRFGRRPLLLIGGVIITICLVIIGSLAFLKTSQAVGGATIAVMCIWVVAYISSAGPCGYLVLGETSTLHLRAKTVGFAVAGAQIFGLIFTYCVPYMLLSTGKHAVGWGLKTSYFFACLACIGVVLIYFFVPEHKGRTYAELDELYNNRIPARKFKGTITTVQQRKAAESQAA